MKFYRYKHVQRLSFFGFNDTLKNNPTSITQKSPQTTATTNIGTLLAPINVINKDTKILRFDINKLSHIQLSQNARLTIEKMSLPLAPRTGPVTIRMNNLNTDSYDSQNNGYSSTLLFTTNNTGETFYNTCPEILYNFSIDQIFFKN